MATAYHRDQVGAPALTYPAAGNSVAQFTSLKTVLKACLITGYGAKPAAGWVLINEGANFIVLRTGTHSGYVCLTWVSGGVVRVYLAETYTGMSGDVMTGDGLKSGNATGSSIPQVLPALSIASSSDSSSWWVVADSKTFALSIIGATSNAELDNATNRGFTLYAGEDSAGAMIALGGAATSSTFSSSVNSFFSSIGIAGMTVLKIPATGLLVGAAALDVVAPGLLRTSATGVFSQIVKLSSANLSKAVWAGASTLSGSLRGIAVVADLTNAASISQSAQCLGRSTAMTYRDANTPITLGDDHTYFVGVAHLASFFLLTDNPAFW